MPKSDAELIVAEVSRHGPQPPAASAGTPANTMLADLKRTFVRQSAQVRAYRAKRDQELAEAGHDRHVVRVRKHYRRVSEGAQ